MPNSTDWLTSDAAPGSIFTAEMLTEEQRLIGRTAAEFVAQEVEPALGSLEQKDWAVARTLVKRCGDLGLLGVDVPELFGGVGLDLASAVVVSEAVGPSASFAATLGAQTNLAIAPILWFGTERQQQQYLPRLVSGDLVGAYALSESGSGSDALGARARAVRHSDGSWRLSGEKLWITNGGFADLFIVFAKIDGSQFSAFIVERSFPGVSTGKEEHKMGLHGSSTTPLLLQDAAVPALNLLGETGKGHRVAFNVLNYGRFKLAAMCSGCAKAAIADAARYASSRRQFDQPIAAFGAIRHKLAEMTIQTYGVESMLYRTAGLLDRAISGDGGGAAPAAALEAYAVEASLLKVAGSEMLDYVLDENVQIHGGNGFVRDYPAERRYRDARVNRIFEGTNEINRLLVPTLLVRRAMKEGRPLEAPPSRAGTGARARRDAHRLKQAALMILGLAARTFGDRLAQEQEVLLLASDIVRDAFAADSAAARAESCGASALHRDVAETLAYDACLRAGAAARPALAAMVSSDTLKSMLDTVDSMLRPDPLDTIGARRRIAEAVIARAGYPI